MARSLVRSPAVRALVLSVLTVVCSCGTSAGGGGGGQAGLAPGTACNPALQGEACATSGTVHLRLVCEAASGTWTFVEACPSGQACSPKPGPAGKPVTQCSGSPFGVDGAGNDGASDAAGPADAGPDGTEPADIGPGDVLSADVDLASCCAGAGASCGYVAACPASCGTCPDGSTCADNTCIVTAGPDVADTSEVPDAEPDSEPDVPSDCCLVKGAECGYVAGCPTSCGACAPGSGCKANQCVWIGSSDAGPDSDPDMGPDSGPDAGPDNGPDTTTCCQAKGAQCGFVAGCTTSCGGCSAGMKCKSNKCVSDGTAPKKKFGEACGADAICKVPPAGASDAEDQAYEACLDSQCETGQCWNGVCSQVCYIDKDVKINATGAPGSDGIEDADAVSDCAGAVMGPAGTAFRCIELASAAQVQSGQSYQVCEPGTTFKTCQADVDCPLGEVCGYKYIAGKYGLFCAPKFVNPGGAPAAKTGQACNLDPTKGPILLCENNACLGGACQGFCSQAADCVTSPGACQGGKCATNGGACSSDADCSAWKCSKSVAFFGSAQPPIGLCTGKSCGLDGDCQDPAYYCRTYWNGVASPDGEPDPTAPGGVLLPGWAPACMPKAPGTAKKGEACDAFPTDADKSAPVCENPTWCVNGSCSGQCKVDGDCAVGQKCGVVEYPFDTSDPLDEVYDYVLPIEVCTPMPGAAGPCQSQVACQGKPASYCRLWLHEAAGSSNPTVDAECIIPDPKHKNIGEPCGAAAGGTLCKSAICLNTNGGTQPGYCSDVCDGKDACPDTLSLAGTTYKTVCRGSFAGWGKLADPYDDLYFPLCLPVHAAASLADCSATKTCGAAGEACFPQVIAMGPDKPAKIEYLCSLVVTPGQPLPTKQVGQVCNPLATNEECASGLCLPDSNGLGYCSKLCTGATDCGGGLTCDTGHMWLPRKDVTKAGIVPICKKVASCIPCSFDYDCGPGYRCTNVGGPGAGFDGRCAPQCTTSGDCLGKDGGQTCKSAKDTKALPISGVSVCTPNC